MALRRLVVLGVTDLVLERDDILLDRRHGRMPRGPSSVDAGRYLRLTKRRSTRRTRRPRTHRSRFDGPRRSTLPLRAYVRVAPHGALASRPPLWLFRPRAQPVRTERVDWFIHRLIIALRPGTASRESFGSFFALGYEEGSMSGRPAEHSSGGGRTRSSTFSPRSMDPRITAGAPSPSWVGRPAAPPVPYPVVASLPYNRRPEDGIGLRGSRRWTFPDLEIPLLLLVC